MRLLLLCLLAVGCAEHSVGTGRIDPDSTDPLGGTGIDSQELRTITERMSRSLLDCSELFARGTPRVVVKPPENRTAFAIDTRNFTDKIRVSLNEFAGSRIRFVAREDIDDVLRERAAKRDGTVGRSGAGVLSGADFLLTGTIGGLSKQGSAGRSDYFSCRFRLVDLETSDLLWEREYEFKKSSELGAVYR